MVEQQEIGTLIGSGCEFNGKLTFIGTVRVEGRFEGEIFSEDTLVVADGADVRGSLKVGTLIVTGGVVDASVEAARLVELHPPGCLKGEIRTPSFQIEKGAQFQGNCIMTEAPDSSPTEPEAPRE